VTFSQLVSLTARIAAQVDPGFAERRRKAAVRDNARVRLFREDSGAAGLSGRDLPPDEALAANANVCARAARYKDSGAFGEARMDQYRATAYLDLLNEVPAWERIASGRLATDEDWDDGDPGTVHDGGDPDDGSPDDGDAGSRNPVVDDEDGDPSPAGGLAPHRPVDLVIPLATLLGVAERPGEGHGFGILDPALCRSLAALAAASPHTTVCVTVIDSGGVAIGHGCARQRKPDGLSGTADPPGGPTPTAALAGRLNLTVTAEFLSSVRRGPTGLSRAPAGWAWTPGKPDSAGDRDWCGLWTLTLLGGPELTVRLEPVPSYECDHRDESRGYQPGDRLRHLVQIRDYTCTNPVCNRHARESDFEHALAYDKGGRTCACNAGARSRKCHRVKQSPWLERHAAETGVASVDHRGWAGLHQRTVAISGLT
jgi:hypothetical protein